VYGIVEGHFDPPKTSTIHVRVLGIANKILTVDQTQFQIVCPISTLARHILLDRDSSISIVTSRIIQSDQLP
jgi:hypothetical protein